MTDSQLTRLIESLENIGIELAATNYLLAQQAGISLAAAGMYSISGKADTIAEHYSDVAQIIKENVKPRSFDK
jgi:hypothetical protein